MMQTIPQLVEIKLLQKQRVLMLRFANGQTFSLPCEYLRVFSPSAEARSHGVKAPQRVTDKQQVNIIGIDPVGHYAVKLIFDDGHHTGIYSWEKLYELAVNYPANWQRYQEQCKEIGE